MANQRRLNELKMIWLDTGIIPQEPTENHSFDVDSAWDRFKEDVIEHPGTNEIPFNPIKRLIQIAAVVLLVVVGSLTLNQFMTSEIQMATLSSLEETSTGYLPDSSMIALNKNSSIEYPTSFTDKTRTVKLKGEAYFDVQHNPEKPFIITAGEAEIKVLGTSFTVSAYDNENITVAVETGKVSLSYLDQEIILTPGMVGKYQPSNKKVVEEKNPAPDITYWRDRKLKFKGTSLQDVVEALNKTYQANITFENPALGQCNLSATFEGEDLDTVLDLVSTALNLSVDKQENQIILNGEGCE